jgi:hypothetical protein
LFDCIRVEAKDPGQPARCFDDYTVVVDREAVPDGVELLELPEDAEKI